MSKVTLRFPGIAKEVYTQLSALAFVEGDLWVGGDEGQSIVRMQTNDDGKEWQSAPPISLAGFLDLPGKKEIDLEGMDWDAESRYLWVIGSHSLKRKDPVDNEGEEPSLERLLAVEPQATRYLLARVPLVVEAGGSRLLDPNEYTNAHFAAQLECKEPAKFRNALFDALQSDPYFGRFVRRELANEGKRDVLGIPSKDNGLDIEGIAFGGTVDGAARLFIGLRGPVLRGYAAVLEVRVTAERGGGTNAGRLKLQPIGADGTPYRRTFLRLDGLGIRDLCFRGDDLLILAGPTMVLDHPVTIYRWMGARTVGTADQIFDQKAGVLDQVQVEAEPSPIDEKGNHAEGMALFTAAAGQAVMILYDAPGASRLPAADTVTGDILALNLPPP